jgi:luciferase family oxidoreductase group 1
MRSDILRQLRLDAGSAAGDIVERARSLEDANRITFGSGAACVASAIATLHDCKSLLEASQRELLELDQRFLKSKDPYWIASRILVAAKFINRDGAYDQLIEDGARHLAASYTEKLSNAAVPSTWLVQEASAALPALGGLVPARLLWLFARILVIVSSQTRLDPAQDMAPALRSICLMTSPFVAIDAKRLYAQRVWEAIRSWDHLTAWSHFSLSSGAVGLALAGILAGINLGYDGLRDDGIRLCRAIASRAATHELSLDMAEPIRVAIVVNSIASLANDGILESAGRRLSDRIVNASVEAGVRSLPPWDILLVLTLAGIVAPGWVLTFSGVPIAPSHIVPSERPIMKPAVGFSVSSRIRLGVLHLGAPDNGCSVEARYASVFDSVSTAEQLGYEHYWLAEHWAENSMWNSPVPIISALLGRTKHIRIGSAGMLLKYHNLLMLAGEFSLLEQLFPGRVDLGLIPSSPGNVTVRRILDLPDCFSSDFRSRLEVLLNLLSGRALGNGRCATLRFPPWPPRTPEVWLMGTGTRSLELAASLGLPYTHSIAHSLNASHDAFSRYRSLLTKPSDSIARPRLAVAGSCADTTNEALTNVRDNPVEFAYPIVVGTPVECTRRLEELHRATGVRDFVFFELARRTDQRLQSLRLLGSALVS